MEILLDEPFEYWCKFTNTKWYMIEWWSELSEYRHQIAQLVELEGARVWIPVLSIIISTIPTFTTFFTYINKQTSLVTGIWWKKHFDEDSVGQARFDSVPIMFSPFLLYLNTYRTYGLILRGDSEQGMWIFMGNTTY